MSELRRKTNTFNNSNPFRENKGLSRNCMSCNEWKSTAGWKKHPFRNYMECAECVAKRTLKE